MNKSHHLRRSISRRTAIQVLATSAVGIVLAACAPPASPTTAPSTKPAESTQPLATQAPQSSAPAQKVTLQFVSPTWNPTVEAVVKTFTDKNPHVTVEAQGFAITDFYVKLETGFAAGAGPDVASGGAAIIQWGASGWLLDMNPYLEKVDRDDYYPAALQNVTYRGKLYSLPFSADGWAIYFRKDLIQEAGFDPNQAPETWEALLERATKATKKSGEDFEVSGIWHSADWPKMHVSYGFVYSNGGKLLEEDEQVYFDDPKTIEAVQWVADWGLKHGVAPKGGLKEDVGGANLAAGKTAIHIRGASVTRPARDQGKVDLIGAWAQPTKVTKSAFSYHNSYYVNAKTKFQDDAIAFTKHMTSTDSIVALATPARGGMPRKSALAKAEWATDPLFKASQDAAEYGHPEGTSRYWIPVRDNMYVPMLDRIWLGQISAEEGLKQVAKEARDFIAKAQRP